MSAQAEEVATQGHSLREELIAAIVLLATAGTLLYTSVGYGLTTGTQPGPGLFPTLVTTLLSLLSMIWVVQTAILIRRKETLVVAVDAIGEESVHLGRVGTMYVLFVIACSLAAVYTLEVLGYMPVMTLYLLALFRVVAKMHWFRATLISLVTSLLTALALASLGVRLPDPHGIIKIMGI